MIKKLIFIVALFAVLFLENSCKNDFNVLSPYRDTTIVYGLLNPADTVQYIRIHKAFLGEGDAYVMAQVADSFYYKDILKVQLERWKNNVMIPPIIDLVRDNSSIVKDTGVFANSPNILYKTVGNDTIHNEYDVTTHEHSIYKLHIENLETGKIITSETPVVSKLIVTNPSASGLVDFTQNPYIIEFYTAYYGRIYDVVVRFHYGEATLSNPFNYVEKTIDWRVGQKFSTNLNASEKMQIKIGKNDFFIYLDGNLTADPNVKRLAGKVDFIFTAGADEFYTYYRVNGFPSGLSQSIPTYTNIKGGLGIFSSRYIVNSFGHDLDGNTKSELATGPYTNDLGFQ
ncbi:MAG: hypothetical protein ABI723_12455 [Bacteroidia bacterium]